MKATEEMGDALRIGVAWEWRAGAHYRAIDPLRAMYERGHEIVFPSSIDGAVDSTRLMTCQVVHVYRRCDEQTRRLTAGLLRQGVAITYDNDDDYTTIPPRRAWRGKPPPELKSPSEFAATTEMALLASVFTTTSEAIAARYQRAGVTRVDVIGNYVAKDIADPTVSPDTGVVKGWNPPDHAYRPPPIAHQGIVVGWVAGVEHRLDADRLRIASALRKLQAAHDDVHVECIGVDLRLPERYRYDPVVLFAELPRRMAGFDLGIAPLVDIPFNRARSDIKLKEYAACGVPWLASPVGPYADLGEPEGGVLVPDGQWFEALDRLVSNHAERQRLASNAAGWGSRSTIDTAADRWERVFRTAAKRCYRRAT